MEESRTTMDNRICMTWSSRYTIDKEGNRIRKSTYEPHIEREGYFFHDLREEELCYLNRVHPKE